jgi:transposase
MRRLYRDDDGEFLLAATLADARRESPGARVAVDDDVRDYWREAKLGEQSARQVASALGVSPQTVANWRARAGVPRRRSRCDLGLTVASLLASGATAEQAAQAVQRHPATVRRIAKAAGLKPSRVSRKLTDDELVQVAAGRTWAQLAEVTGRAISTLRTRVYSDPTLARRLRAVMIRGGSRVESV